MNDTVSLDNAIECFNEAIGSMGISLDKDITDKLGHFYHMLIEANSYMNLTSITDVNEVFIKHFADSLSILRKYDDLNLKSNLSIVDIGCGAGFPSIPLKIALPNIQLTAVDATSKKVNFINSCIKELGLKNAIAVQARAEELGHSDKREKYDISVSRAVARLSVLSEYCLPLVKPGGYMVAYKAAVFSDELNECRNTFGLLSSELYAVDSFILPVDDSSRSNIIIKKLKPCSGKYPRSNSQIKAKPLN